MTDLVTPAQLAAAANALHDLLAMLGVDPDERPEHGGPSVAETLAGAAISAAAPHMPGGEG